MSRAALLTLGVAITLAAAALVAFLVFSLPNSFRIIVGGGDFFQVSFIWTCAEFTDASDEILPRDDTTDPQ
jgi:hypothetical protein